MNSIRCPNCQQEIVLSEAVALEIESEALLIQKNKYRRDIEEARKGVSRQFNEELELMKLKLEEKNRRLQESEKEELELRKEKLRLQEEKEKFEVEKVRELDREREKLKDKLTFDIEKRLHLEKLELEKKISDLKKSLEDAQRKATQSSQQLQGEVAELDLEKLFIKSFPSDSIEAIGKGINGADIRQVVKSSSGINCGTILWESKRTKAWSDSWISKLKQDLLQDKANIPAIVSEALPDEAKAGIGLKDGVWVASPELALMLSALLRSRLLEAARQKQIIRKQQTKSEQLYAYITSHEFQHQVEAMIESYQDMRQQIDKERSSYERNWKMREMQINRLINGVAGVYGSIQGIAEKALPTIPGLNWLDDDQQTAND